MHNIGQAERINGLKTATTTKKNQKKMPDILLLYTQILLT